MTVRRSPQARWGLLGLILAGLVLDTGCSEFRARRRLGRPPATISSAGSDGLTTEGEIITAPSTGTPTYSSPSLGRTSRSPAPATVGEPALDPDPLPSIGASVTPGRTDSAAAAGAVIPTSAASLSLRAPVPVDPTPAPVASPPPGPALGPPLASPVPSGRLASTGPRDAAVTPAEASLPPVAVVLADARTALDGLTSYQLNLHRQERVNGTLLPAEDLVMSIRRQPQATRLTWVDGPHQGREVLYRADEPGGQMHVRMGNSRIPMPPMTLAPTSPLVMRNSRHPITEAGLDPLVAGLLAADQAGSLVDLGMEQPSPLDHPHRGLLRRSAEGEVWRVYLDPISHLPALVDCRATDNSLLELDHFRDLQPNPAELATAEAFDPATRWGSSRGLLGRLALQPEENAPTRAR